MTQTQDRLQYVIEIAKGLGVIKFGMTTDDVHRYLGPPDETEFVDESESIAIWYYTNHKLQIMFEMSRCRPDASANKPKKITRLTTRHPDATLWERKIIGRTEDEVLSLFRTHGHDGFIREEERVGSLTYTAFRLVSSRVSLDFRDGFLRFILWGSTSS